MHLRNLAEERWTLRAVGDLDDVPEDLRDRDIPATVPGCVHTDLLAAGLIEDPYLDRNEQDVQWIGRTDWQYRCEFQADPDLLEFGRLELVCEGLDTLATVELNGHPAGQTANMHHPHRLDVADAVREGTNTLVIHFASADRYVQEQIDRRDWPERTPWSMIRKMACNFGWDWGAKLTTAGVWRPIYLASWDTARLARVRPLVTRADRQGAHVRVLLDVERLTDAPLTAVATLYGPDGATASATETVSADATEVSIALDVPDPKLWWPRGHGDQPLYDLSVELGPGDDGPLDRWTGRLGLRTVELDTVGDEIGSAFTLRVNGRGIFCKGASWIPDDCFPTRIGPGRYRKRVAQAAGANMNMLRVWGGGFYEDEDFYNACDEMGVLIWQDFMFACAAYPEEPSLAEKIEAEASYQIARLSPHPSVVLWCGSNENIWFAHMKDWDAKFADAGWGKAYYLDLLPSLVERINPTVPYWPSSPYSGSMDIDPIDDAHGNKHVWDVCKHKDYIAYREHSPRFASEFGQQAPPSFATLARAIPSDQRTWNSPAMLAHQKCSGGQDVLQERLSEHFDVPDDFDDWLYLTQLVQARAIATAVEWWRSRRPVCMGALYWQLNDCWPVTSWSAIDGDGRPKPLWYASRRFFADRLLTVQPDGDGLAVFADNDSDTPWTGKARATRAAFDGTVLASCDLKLNVPARTCARIDLPAELATPGDPGGEALSVTCEGERAWWWFDIDRDIDYPAPEFDAELTREGSTHKLTITARTLLAELAIFPDRIDHDATISDQLVTLLPGESVTFVIESAHALDKAQLTAPPVLQCANRFGRKPASGA